jgi:hypothetical protein
VSQLKSLAAETRTFSTANTKVQPSTSHPATYSFVCEPLVDRHNSHVPLHSLPEEDTDCDGVNAAISTNSVGYQQPNSGPYSTHKPSYTH